MTDQDYPMSASTEIHTWRVTMTVRAFAHVTDLKLMQDFERWTTHIYDDITVQDLGVAT